MSVFSKLKMSRALILALMTCLPAVASAEYTSLHEASEIGHVAKVKRLLAEGENVNARDGEEQTPLHYASSKGHEGVVKVLLAEGASVNAKSKTGATPLHLAIWRGHPAVIKILVAAGGMDK